MGDYVADEQRDQVMQRLLQLPENKVSIWTRLRGTELDPYLWYSVYPTCRTI